MNTFVFFFLYFITFWIAEKIYPFIVFPTNTKRKICNISLLCTASALSYVVLPTGLISVATYVHIHSFGVLHWVSFPTWLQTVIGVLVLDCALYWQHRLSHSCSWLWRFHQVHHWDKAVDITTALRFHPIEITLSLLYKSIIIFGFGISPLATGGFVVLLFCCAVFNHSNIRFPPKIEMILCKYIITPSLHRIHHSQLPKEHSRNYGTILTVWDYLFDSFTLTHKKTLKIGIRNSKQENTTVYMHCLPFLKQIFRQTNKPKNTV